MSGSPGGLPKSEFLKWVSDVYDVAMRALETAVKALAKRADRSEKVLASHEERVSEIERAQHAQDAHLDDLEGRVRALEGSEPQPEPEPEPEPEPGPVPPADDPIKGEASSVNSLEEYPKTPPVTRGDVYVDGNRGGSGNGRSLSEAFRTLDEGLAALGDGQTLVVRELRDGSAYRVSGIRRSRSWSRTTTIIAYGDDRPLIDARGANEVLRLAGANEKWCRFRFVNGAQYGVRIDGERNTIEDIEITRCATAQYGAGVFVGGPSGRRNLLQDLFIWRLGDGSSGGTNTPDGVAFTASPRTENTHENVGVRIAVANATDDGIDLYRAVDTLLLECSVVGAGYYWNGNRQGEGHGFKLGGETPGPNTVRGSIAAYCANVGFNANGGRRLTYQQLTSVHNSRGVAFRDYGREARAEGLLLALNAREIENDAHIPPPGSLVRNSWQEGVTAQNVRFVDPRGGDFSLQRDSRAIGRGPGGGNMGAGRNALALAHMMINHPEVFVPGRG